MYRLEHSSTAYAAGCLADRSAGRTPRCDTETETDDDGAPWPRGGGRSGGGSDGGGEVGSDFESEASECFRQARPAMLSAARCVLHGTRCTMHFVCCMRAFVCLRSCCAAQSFASFVVSALQRYGLQVARCVPCMLYISRCMLQCCAARFVLQRCTLHVACCKFISYSAICMLPFAACGSAYRDNLMLLRASTRSTHPAHSPH